ncbi:MAG: DTW domain-containing protein [Paucibacter sp.]|nr:DTW domain-containing protein [Roseateles sp.]
MTASLACRLCPRCERAACLCALLPPIALEHETELLLLQHPQERLQAKGTAPLLRLGLAHCRVEVGEVFELPPDGRVNVLLYPGPGPGPGPAAQPLPAPARVRLIVLDGTWRQSRKLMLSNPWLAAMPRMGLDGVESSRYAALRRAHKAGQLSTLEAAVLALERLEGERFEPLWDSFERFISARSALRARR